MSKTVEVKELEFQQMKQDMEQMKADIRELNMVNTPMHLNEQMNTVINRVDSISADVVNVRVDMQRIKEEKMVEYVTDQELKKIFSESDVPLKELAAYLNVEVPTVSKLINGGSQNIMQRHKIKQYLLKRLKESQ